MAREYFTKADTFTRKMPLVKAARKVYRLLKQANLIKEFSCKEDYKLRHKLQIKALIALDDVETYLDTFDEEKTIPNKAEWVRLIIDTENLLKGWIRSDIKRWKKVKEARKAEKLKREQLRASARRE